MFMGYESVFQAFIITLIVLCFFGYLLVQLRVIYKEIFMFGKNGALYFPPAVPGYINALFAGVLLETLLLASTHTHRHHLQLKCICAIIVVY